MTTSPNPSRGHYSPPPLVTHYSEPTQAMPVAPKRRSSAGTWAAAITTAVLSIAAGAIGATVASGPAAPPASCLEALDHAEDIRAQASELADYYASLADISSRSVDAAASWDWAEIESLTAEIEDLTADMEDLTARAAVTRDAYEAAAADCRAEGGESL